jgi:Holliday junction resolvase
MGTNYARGYVLEWKIKKILEKNGFLVFRSPASRDAADLFASKEGKSFLIQAKKTGVRGKDNMYIYGLEGLIDMAKEHRAKPLLAYSFYYSPIYVKEVSSGSLKLSKGGENLELDRFVREI